MEIYVAKKAEFQPLLYETLIIRKPEKELWVTSSSHSTA
jgi:hypothetical protein